VKLPRIAAAGIGVAIVAASALAFVAPASAATPGVVFVLASDVDAAATIGTVGWGNLGVGPVTSSLDGLTAPDSAELIYGFTSTVPTVGGTTLVGTGSATYFTASDTADLYAEFTWFTDAGKTDDQFFVANSAGSDGFNDPTALWFSTVAVGSIPSFTLATLAAFDAQLALDPVLAAASLAGAGAYNDAGVPVDYYTFSAGGNLFYFTPQPTPSAGPTPITALDLGTGGMGFTALTTAFVPTETISAYLQTPSVMYNPLALGGVADANGAILYTYVAPTTATPPGNYALRLVGDDSNIEQVFTFTILAPGLAATGVDVTTPAIAAGVLVLAGAALAFVVAKRRKNA
jgi:LPXTG-motif cell wall-anchored protein